MGNIFLSKDWLYLMKTKIFFYLSTITYIHMRICTLFNQRSWKYFTISPIIFMLIICTVLLNFLVLQTVWIDGVCERNYKLGNKELNSTEPWENQITDHCPWKHCSSNAQWRMQNCESQTTLNASRFLCMVLMLAAVYGKNILHY